jgi:RNA polymerase subunit RPABC4/transcription elongation factor Spt4
MPTNWRVYKRETIAACVAAAEVPGFLSKRVTVGPNEAALVVRDGQLESVLTEGRVEVADLFDRIATWFGGGADVTVFFVDLAPFDVTIYLGESTAQAASAAGESVTGGEYGWTDDAMWASRSASAITQVDVSQLTVAALSSDREVVQAGCHLRLAVNIDSAAPMAAVGPLIGLLRGKRALATWDVAALLRDAVVARVLVPEVARHPASALRGDTDLLARIEAATRQQLAHTLAGCGLRLDQFQLVWGLTESERADLARQRAAREEAALEFAKNRRAAQLARDHDLERLRLQNLNDLKQAQARGDEQLKTLLLLGELERDRLAAGNQVDLAKIDAALRDVTLAVEQKEATARLEQRRAADELRLELEDRELKQKHAARLRALEAEDKEMWSMVKMQIEMANQKHDREMARRRQEIDAQYRQLQADIENRYQQRKLKLDESMARMGVIERLVSQGLSAGATDAGVLKTVLEQMTEQEYATTSDAMVESRAQAQAARSSVEGYREAQRDERRHQTDMTRLSAELMSAAKPHTVAPPVAAPPVAPASACRACAQPLQAGWKACPACGTATAPPPAAACPNCGGGVQPNWKACPACGGGLVAIAPRCRGCGAEVRPNWKACPACGNSL